MDLADLSSVREAGGEVLKTVPQIDALMCNAAIAQVPTQEFTVDGFESQLGTNHYGHFVLCGMLFDRIEESKGRIVVVASLGYKMGLKTILQSDMQGNSWNSACRIGSFPGSPGNDSTSNGSTTWDCDPWNRFSSKEMLRPTGDSTFATDSGRRTRRSAHGTFRFS